MTNDIRERIAQIIDGESGAPSDLALARADDLIAALPDMVKPLGWRPRRKHPVQAKFEMQSKCGLYKVIEWLDGSGHVLFFGVLGPPVDAGAPRSARGHEALCSHAQSHHRARIMDAFGITPPQEDSTDD